MKTYKLLLLLPFLPGCALFPSTTAEVVETARGKACVLEEVEAYDSFAWKFLSISTERKTTVRCHKPQSE